MKEQDKKNAEQLADALLADALQSENPTELYHSLERMEKGMQSLYYYVATKRELEDAR